MRNYVKHNYCLPEYCKEIIVFVSGLIETQKQKLIREPTVGSHPSVSK